MRVTKTIREYITKEVESRIAPKYAAEEAEAKRQNELMDNMLEACAKAAQEAYNICFDEMFPIIADFAEDNRANKHMNFYLTGTAQITDRHQISNVQCWRTRKQREVNKLTDDIVVTLELGGTKAELMEMLDKIGEDTL